MAYTYEELHKKTVAELRKIAKENEHEVLKGYSTMHKDTLLLTICTALEIDTHEHHEVVGIDKGKIKLKIRKLKVERNVALDAHDHKKLKEIRREIRRMKRKIRKATILSTHLGQI